ncbi:hypothetical protein MiSe_59810 [Microseira wollei NIES-4236]|uniref:DUF29 domain-containing protein n=1 Tax=Microseira wollei NIES-4236 TaxID=2530354 RepID=A0AAV3WKK6_9CYAN|nr:DUF29 family protein [Microseira wollei]GET41169.1 hypothetical protein MiSe_59810 [Microseira wollei NIES-4236]
MATEIQAFQKSLYETDFVRWVETTVEQLRNQEYASVDWTNLIEEIEDMSKWERKSLKSNLVVLLLHLLSLNGNINQNVVVAVGKAVFGNIADVSMTT